MKDGMTAFDRRIKMLFFLLKHRKTTVIELANVFSVCRKTAYNDLIFLSRLMHLYLYRKTGIAGGVFLYEEYRNGLFLYLTVEEERFLEELAQMLEPDKKLRMQSIINRFSMPKIRT